MSQSHWELIGKVLTGMWAAIGPLIGVLVGAYIANRNQRKQWLADNKKQEYRELLTSVTSASTALIENAQAAAGNANTRTQQVAAKEEYFKAIRTLQDRIFIAEELAKINLFDRWGTAMKALVETKNVHKFEDSFEEMKKEIVKMATKLN